MQQPRREIMMELSAHAEAFDETLDLSGLATILKFPTSTRQSTPIEFDESRDDWRSWAFLTSDASFRMETSEIIPLSLSLEWLPEFFQFKMKKAQKFLDATTEFWQCRIGKSISSEQAREAAANVVGFIQTLARWEKAER